MGWCVRVSTTKSNALLAAECRTSTSPGCSRRLDRANGKVVCNAAGAFLSALPESHRALRDCLQVLLESLRFEDEPVARSRLPRGVGQPVAVPTAPEVATRSIELSDPSTTVTQKVSSSSAEVPRHPCDWEYLIVERDNIVVPMPWPNARRVKFISVNPPISRNVADVARSG